MSKKPVTMCMGCIEDGWISSETYYDYLFAAFQKISDEDFTISRWCSNRKGVGLLRRRFFYPKDLIANVSGPLHLTDQSYADALLRYSDPAVLTVNDIAFWHERGVNPLRNKFRKDIAKGMGRARHLMAISQFTADEIQEHLGIDSSKISAILYAIGDSYFEAIPELPAEMEKLISNRPFLLHVGSLIARKGMNKFLKAYARNKDFPILLQAGGSPDREMLELIQSLGIQDRVIFLGLQSRSCIHALYGHAEVFVFPSEYEGFGIPPVEAHVCGTKIFTTNMPSIRESLKVNPAIEWEMDLESWANGLEKVLNDPKKERPPEEELYRYSWERWAKEVLEVYRKYLLDA